MFAILGATGKVGRTTIKQLRSQGAPVRAVVHKSSNADDLSALGCEIAAADLNETAAIKIAIRGTDVVQFRRLPSTVTFLRSAEHMQNWARVIKVASETGVLSSLHHPVGKRFPTVSAQDVGHIAAKLLTDRVTVSAPRVVHVEGPRRYDANEVAATLGNILGREVVARELPQSDWIRILTQAGAGPSYARLVFDLYVAHNAGRIDVEPGATDTRFGTTELRDVFISLLGR
jgi:NAD(P)H dehydrogenase (quinone)